MQHPPIPANEMERVIDLSEFDVDYTAQHDNLKDLTKLAAKVAGTEISLIFNGNINKHQQQPTYNFSCPKF